GLGGGGGARPGRRAAHRCRHGDPPGHPRRQGAARLAVVPQLPEDRPLVWPPPWAGRGGSSRSYSRTYRGRPHTLGSSGSGWIISWRPAGTRRGILSGGGERVHRTSRTASHHTGPITTTTNAASSHPIHAKGVSTHQ